MIAGTTGYAIAKCRAMKNTLQTIGGIALALLALDFFGFAAWVLSGQTPADGFYIGTITAHLLKALFALFS